MSPADMEGDHLLARLSSAVRSRLLTLPRARPPQSQRGTSRILFASSGSATLDLGSR